MKASLDVRKRFAGLWREADFLKLWAAQTTSQFGTRISLLAIPLAAVVTLDATPFEMGLLTAVSQAPFLLVGLFAGVWVDRLRRRPVLIAADLGRFVLLLLIPILTIIDRLQIEQLYGIVFLVGVLTVFFDVADHSFLPTLVGRSHLTEANGKLTMSRSIAQFAGPSIAGLLIRILTAPIAIVVDACSYLVSALFLGRIQTSEPAPNPRPPDQNIRSEIKEGLWAVVGHPLLRPIASCTATSNLFSSIAMAVYVLYATRTLDIGAGLLGIIFAVGSIGALLAAFIARAIMERLGLGRTIIFGSLMSFVGALLTPLAQGQLLVAASFLVVGRMLMGFGSTIYNIHQVSLRQTVTPDHLLGRMNASMRFIIWGTMPIGGLIGGVLGELIGLRPTLAVSALGSLLGAAWIILSPVRGLEEFPVEVDEPEPTPRKAVA